MNDLYCCKKMHKKVINHFVYRDILDDLLIISDSIRVSKHGSITSCKTIFSVKIPLNKSEELKEAIDHLKRWYSSENHGIEFRGTDQSLDGQLIYIISLNTMVEVKN